MPRGFRDTLHTFIRFGHIRHPCPVLHKKQNLSTKRGLQSRFAKRRGRQRKKALRRAQETFLGRGLCYNRGRNEPGEG